eukprot:GHVU01210037.1.p1 GENE.GHVU01210037.1~~GHVU01210037.1.p1  ORF type:complete len:209 (-),score=32.77 GHVU01210037.1:1493-2119(-)
MFNIVSTSGYVKRLVLLDECSARHAPSETTLPSEAQQQWQTDLLNYFSRLRAVVKLAAASEYPSPSASMSVMGPAGMRRAGADDDGSCGGSDSEAANCDDPDCRSWNTPLTEDALSHFDNSAACRVLRTGAESLRADDSVLLSAEALQWLWASLVALDSLQAMQADVAHDLQFIRRKLERASTVGVGDGIGYRVNVEDRRAGRGGEMV